MTAETSGDGIASIFGPLAGGSWHPPRRERTLARERA